MQRQCQVRFTKSLNFIIVHSTNDFNGNESCSWFNQLEIKYVCYVQSHVHCFIVFTQICLKNTIAKIIWVRLILHIIKFAKKKTKTAFSTEFKWKIWSDERQRSPYWAKVFEQCNLMWNLWKNIPPSVTYRKRISEYANTSESILTISKSVGRIEWACCCCFIWEHIHACDHQ